MAVFEARRELRAAPAEVWRTVRDVVGYADVAPNLSHAEVVAGSGEGMIRRCTDTRGGSWSERCTLWDEDARRYRFDVDTSNYPYPFARMAGTWSVEDAPRGAAIVMRFEYEPKFGALGRLADTLFIRRRFASISERLLDNWEQAILAQRA